MASAMLATYPEVFTGGAIIAGLPFGCANTVPEAFDRMRGHRGPSKQDLQRLLRGASPHNGPWPRISIWQGSADHTVASSNAEAIAGQWRAVHKVDRTPTRTETLDGHIRQVWCDADGRALIESYTIAGLGHGTPLMTKGADALGAAGAFMLDVGISSTRHIANFWGIVDSERSKTATSLRPKSESNHSPLQLRTSDTLMAETDRSVADRNPEASAPGSNAVQKIIEDALRKAGLIR